MLGSLCIASLPSCFALAKKIEFEHFEFKKCMTPVQTFFVLKMMLTPFLGKIVEPKAF